MTSPIQAAHAQKWQAPADIAARIQLEAHTPAGFNCALLRYPTGRGFLQNMKLPPVWCASDQCPSPALQGARLTKTRAESMARKRMTSESRVDVRRDASPYTYIDALLPPSVLHAGSTQGQGQGGHAQSRGGGTAQGRGMQRVSWVTHDQFSAGAVFAFDSAHPGLANLASPKPQMAAPAGSHRQDHAVESAAPGMSMTPPGMGMTPHGMGMTPPGVGVMPPGMGVMPSPLDRKRFSGTASLSSPPLDTGAGGHDTFFFRPMDSYTGADDGAAAQPPAAESGDAQKSVRAHAHAAHRGGGANLMLSLAVPSLSNEASLLPETSMDSPSMDNLSHQVNHNLSLNAGYDSEDGNAGSDLAGSLFAVRVAIGKNAPRACLEVLDAALGEELSWVDTSQQEQQPGTASDSKSTALPSQHISDGSATRPGSCAASLESTAASPGSKAVHVEKPPVHRVPVDVREQMQIRQQQMQQKQLQKQQQEQRRAQQHAVRSAVANTQRRNQALWDDLESYEAALPSRHPRHLEAHIARRDDLLLNGVLCGLCGHHPQVLLVVSTLLAAVC